MNNKETQKSTSWLNVGIWHAGANPEISWHFIPARILAAVFNIKL